MKKTMSPLILFSLLFAVTCKTESDQKPGLSDFSFKGQPINPKCVNLLQTWISENTSIITKSIIIDTCQNSNLAFEGEEYLTNQDGSIGYYEDTNNAQSYFSYKVLGRTSNKVFVLFHSGSIGLYKFEEESITFDFSTKKSSAARILTKLSETRMPCFVSAKLSGNALSVNKHEFDEYAPTALQCKKEVEQLIFDLSDFK